MLIPKRIKFRKWQKVKISGKQSNIQTLKFGCFGVLVTTAFFLNAKLLEASRRILTRTFNRTGVIYFRVYPDHPVTRKPNEVRIGKGKGAVSFWGTPLKSGQLIFEIEGVPKSLVIKALSELQKKFPVPLLLKTYDSA